MTRPFKTVVVPCARCSRTAEARDTGGETTSHAGLAAVLRERMVDRGWTVDGPLCACPICSEILGKGLRQLAESSREKEP